eukprot:CAMPEP_0178410292 /NCGR_PEP_ID=MMETSP0689_2-20121128/20903_1 /TAXON_ID=160604 /ORGANISM="Amphidinium massartii, Strain CS-259" /LENGTH=437 /DNA_ID=CAMNT_0020031461 /DNA_START=68 /DNA_END=1381 /DNA_ORIENTATION=+
MSLQVDTDYLAKQGIAEHLEKVVKRVVLEKPKDACGLVEVLSRVVKNDGKGEVEPAIDPEVLQSRIEKIEAIRKLDKPPVDEGGELVTVCGINDFMEEGDVLSWAGVGFGVQESYQVMCSLRMLASKVGEAGVSKLRFWGKVLGTHADYYIAEAQRDGGGEPEEGEEDMEPAGVGVNQFGFYATTDLCSDWSLLPDLKPREIIAARQTKKLLSGDLETPVVTHPSFPGKEKVLLRAMIAMISADTTLGMKGFLIRAEEDDPTISQNEEFQPLPPPELLKRSSWAHQLPHILKNGKTTHPEIPEEEEDNEEVNQQRKKMMEEQEADPLRDQIRTIEEDGLQWVIRQVGDNAVYVDPTNPAVPSKSRAVTLIRSLTWPGAVTVSRSGVFQNFYVGYGISSDTPDFFYRAPPDVQEEPVDPGEPEEPQGEEAPKEEEGEA